MPSRNGPCTQVFSGAAHPATSNGMQRVALFGATSAIGADVARCYAHRGARLALVGRNQEKLNALSEELGERVSGEYLADFTRCNAEALVAQVVRDLGGIDVAIIAHGDLGDQLASERDYGAAAHIFSVNLLSVVALVIPLANLLEAQGRGHLAVLSSVAGERGRPRNYTYGAAKGALTTYMQGVRSRLWPKVQVHTIKLGPVDTPMTVNHPKNPLFAQSDDVARATVKAIDRGIGEAFVPWYWRPIMETVERLPEPIFQRFKFLSDR